MELKFSIILFLTICFLIFKKHSVLSTDGSNKQKLESDEINRKFANFINKYNKMYLGEGEYEKRLKIFKKNVEDINRRNENYCDVKFTINKFADMTDSEFKLHLGFENTEEKCSHANPTYRFDTIAPEEFDWRHYNVVTAVKDQGDCGSCTAFTTVATIESRHAIKHHVLHRLSEQQLLDCTERLHCDTGAIPRNVVEQVIEDKGVVLECEYKYKMKKNKCQVLGRKRRAKVKDMTLTKKMRSEDLLKSIVYNYGPVIAGVKTTTPWHFYTEGVASAESLDCEPDEKPEHLIVIVGYGVTKDHNKTPYWIIKNSWSQYWGENGYIRLKRGENACNILAYIMDITVE